LVKLDLLKGQFVVMKNKENIANGESLKKCMAYFLIVVFHINTSNDPISRNLILAPTILETFYNHLRPLSFSKI